MNLRLFEGANFQVLISEYLSDSVHFIQLEIVFFFALSRQFGQEILPGDNGPAIV